MAPPADLVRGAQTYLPEPESRAELLDFAEALREIERLVEQNASRAALIAPNGDKRVIPDEIFRILDQVANALADGQGITVVPQGMSMTTQQAADFLGISRPTLVRLLEAGDIPFDKPGRHRRVKLEDLVDYQASARAGRRAALRELQRANLDAAIKVGKPEDLLRRSELVE
jgi:excisionase family DNA binding protein